MYSSPDISTMLLLIPIVLVCRSVLLLYVWYFNRSYVPARLWAIGSTVIAAGVLLIGMRGWVPLPVSVLAGHGAVITGWMLIAGGTLTAAGRRPPWRAGSWLALAILPGTLWFLFVAPDYGLRTVFVGLPGAVFDAYTAWCCLRSEAPPRIRTTLRVLAATLILSVVAGIFKDIYTLVAGVSALLEPAWGISLYYLAVTLVWIVSTVLYVLLPAQQLHEELDLEIERRKRAQASMQLAALVYQHSSEGMIVTEADGTIINVNPAFTAMTGYAPADVLGKTPRILKSDRHDAAFYADMWHALTRKGAWQGEVWNRRKDGTLFAERVTINTLYDLHGRAQRYVALFHDITEQHQAAEKLFYQATHDLLTGLANRQYFFEQLAGALSMARRTESFVGLLFMDLDRFKAINDTHGHEAGDQVLKEVSQRWLACIRDSDTLARIGGDEFALLVGGLAAPGEAAVIAGKLVLALQEPVSLRDGQRCAIGGSIGIAVYPDNAVEMDSLVAAADAAMYVRKVKGVTGYDQAATQASTLNGHKDWIVFGDADYVGITLIDQQHRTLATMINDLNRSIMMHRADDVLKTQFGALIAYAQEHFSTELRLMTEHAYPDKAAHHRTHEQLAEQLAQMHKRFQPGDEIRLLQITKDWLMEHVHHADRALGLYLRSLGLR